MKRLTLIAVAVLLLAGKVQAQSTVAILDGPVWGDGDWTEDGSPVSILD